MPRPTTIHRFVPAEPGSPGAGRDEATSGGQLSTAFAPAVDVYECGDEVVVEVELPGVVPDRVQVLACPGSLLIQGAKMDAGGREKRYACAERAFGPFRRSVALPPGALTEAARAEYGDGLLRVRIPRGPVGRRVSIEVPDPTPDRP